MGGQVEPEDERGGSSPWHPGGTGAARTSADGPTDDPDPTPPHGTGTAGSGHDSRFAAPAPGPEGSHTASGPGPSPSGWNQPAPGGGPGPGATGGSPGSGPWGPGGFTGFGHATSAPKPGIIPLRPLRLGELLDGAFQLIRRYPRVVLGGAAVIAVIAAVVQAPFAYLASGRTAASAFRSSLDATALGDSAAQGAADGLAPGLVQFVLTTVFTGLLMVVVGRAVLGAPVDLRQCWEAARPRLLGLFGVVLLGLAIAIGVVAVCALPLLLVLAAGGGTGGLVATGILGGLVAVVALVALNTLLSVATPAYVLEGLPVVAALRRSVELVRTRFWPVLGTLILAGIVAGLVGQILVVPLGLLSGFLGAVTGQLPLFITAIQVLSTLIALVITLPFQSGVTGLIYVDLRMRREGFDLALQQAGSAGAAPAARPGPM